MDDGTPDAQEQEESETIALPVKSELVILAIPQNQDNLKILCSKLTAIADVLTSGRSVAVATGYSAAANQEQCAVRKAIAQMSPSEGKNGYGSKTIVVLFQISEYLPLLKAMA